MIVRFNFKRAYVEEGKMKLLFDLKIEYLIKKIRQITTYLFGFGEDGFDICVAESTINGLLIFGKFGKADFCRFVS